MTASEREAHLREQMEKLADKIDSPLLTPGYAIAKIIRAVLDACPASEPSKDGTRVLTQAE